MRTKNSTTLCVIMHGVYKPWTDITEIGQENTWLQSPHHQRISIVHAYGIPVRSIGIKFDKIHENIRFSGKWPHLFLNIFDWILLFPFLLFVPRVRPAKLLKSRHDQIQAQFPDIYLTHRWKELAVIKYFLDETKHEFLYMTTSSSYIRLEKLLEAIDDFDTPELYAGSIPNVTGRFASGANRVISRGVAQRIISNRIRWSPRWLGDFGMGRLCESIGIQCHEMKTLKIDSLKSVNLLTAEEILQNHHFRLKSGDLKNRNDIEIMKRLHILSLEASK